jgi:ubiquinone/menaquinone biosynthesis C-methylase UbiE
MSGKPPFDPDDFKVATRDQWNSAAKGWNEASELILRALLREATETMLDMANVNPGSRVVDVAAGAGAQTLDIAKRVGSNGYVLATDLSPEILKFAGDNARRAGYRNVETKVADGEDLGLQEASFDAAICRLGLMFYPEPLKGLHEIFRALKQGGRACTMVFSTPEANPCVVIVLSTALKHAGLPPRDPYQPGGLLSLGKPGLIDDLFDKAGFREVETRKVTATFMLPSVKEYLNLMSTSAAPIVQLLGKLDKAAKEAAWAEMADRLSAFNTARGWEGPNELLLTAGAR